MKAIAALLLILAPLAGCRHPEEEAAEKPGAQRTESEAQPASDREQIESEVREGGFKDPGGAKDVRQETEEQQKEQQQQADETNQ